VTRVSDRYLEQLTTTALHKARRLALSRSGHHGAQDTIDAVEYRVATVGAFPTVLPGLQAPARGSHLS